ncbi:uncharacterized protein FIBRA_06245 [Fibroporia radiculosa]|uniref:Importin-13 n=1 Tax=Fibroporia radiculosa TaxID=599839 RepID=J4IB58_9APHY|nr:uncharacterized protein FIBRA_06245 [Fibroporia radiculosa]CCM04086.1 predicted protein [Fibroporia radiculosa]
MATNFLPVLSAADVQRATELIQQAYAPQNHLSSEDQRRLQQELFEIQKRQEAWGLVLPFLYHDDPNVQFFGAHTIQVKTTRDWEGFPQEHALQLRDMVVDLTGRLIAAGRSKVILRKLFVAITSLALKLCPGTPSRWPDWLTYCVNTMSSLGGTTEHILDFLAIVAEEVETADLLPPSKGQMQRTLLEFVPTVVQAMSACIAGPQSQSSPHEMISALKCMQAWLGMMPANDLTPLIPALIALLNPIDGEYREDAFVLASDTFQEIMAKSALSDGSGTKTLTEPLLLWSDAHGRKIIEATLNGELLVALGEHSTLYLAANIASLKVVSPSPPPPLPTTLPSPILPTKSHLVQTFLRLILAYTALPGYYAVDEEESELTLGFWYLFQEALWSAEYEQDFEYTDGEAVGAPGGTLKEEQAHFRVAKAVYSELVQILRRKVVWPNPVALRGWPRDQKEKFQVYRRDVGDTLVNAYYILRDDLLGFYVNDILERLASRQEHDGWEEIEGSLHCIMAVQEAVPIESNLHLTRLFGPDVLGRLPVSKGDRIRRTALSLIGSYASWFTKQSEQSGSALLMNSVSYVVSALPDPSLCLPAANALRDLCDANREALAPHIGAFAELHATLSGIPESEQSKVLQSIASVIQALPPADAIPPIEAIVNPVVQKLYNALQTSQELPDEARIIALQQLETISGVARGLTRSTDSLLIFDDAPEVQEEARQMRLAREDPRMVKLRDAILDGIRRIVGLWSTDASVCDALSEVFKAITSLPSDVTLLSLPPGPLLEVICLASQKQLTAVWLSLATMLIIQLDPPTLVPTTFKPIPGGEADGIVLSVLAILLQTALSFLGQPGTMEANPDIVQSFFSCMDTIAQHFITTFYRLPSDLFNALMQCAITSVGLQERYSLVSACSFLSSLINRTCTTDELSEAKIMLAQTHGRSIIKVIMSGFAGMAPRTATQNLIELLSVFVTRFPAETRTWMTDVLHAEDFAQSRATVEAKEKFVKTIFGSRSVKRIREAAQQFTLVARGLEGTSFGYSSMTM